MADLRSRMAAGEMLAGTFLKTASIDIIEVMAKSGLDFVCLDAEHAPFDRARLDACLAVARALDFPVLVRVPSALPQDILQVLDAGAVGVVVPHVMDGEAAAAIAKASRFGPGGRGYAGSSRWAGFTTRSMPELLKQSQTETIVIAQIEDIEGVDNADAIAAAEGIDGIFLGPADLSVAYGHDHQTSDDLMQAIERVGAAAKAHGKTYMTFTPNVAKSAEWHERFGFTMFFVASEHSWMLQGAKSVAEGVHAIKS
jgi:2-keto-3-deoxy-L-rhamnonate aldolase RhmA